MKNKFIASLYFVMIVLLIFISANWIGFSLHRSQELYFSCLHNQIVPLCVATIAKKQDPHECNLLLKLGQKLAVDVSANLKLLS